MGSSPLQTILVTDPIQRASLAAVRALGTAGYRVVTIGPVRGLAGHSRYVTQHVACVKQKEEHPSHFRDCVQAAVREFRVDCILPITDRASQFLIGYNEYLGAPVAGASKQAYRAASNKLELLKVAASLGIKVPKQVEAEVAGEYPAELEQLRFPVVAKPSSSVVESEGATAKHSVAMVDSVEVLESVLRSYPESAFPILVQERTIGFGIGVFLLRHNKVTHLCFGHRRIREKPPSGGVSTYRESLAPPAALVAQCEELLDALDYSGVAMIEFKQDATTGDFVLMEINARLWGSLQLATDAGVNFPVMLVKLTLGEPVTSNKLPNAGVRAYWEFGELDHALAIWRRSHEELHIPREAKIGLGAALRVLLDRRISDFPEVFRWHDPRPFINEMFTWIRNK